RDQGVEKNRKTRQIQIRTGAFYCVIGMVLPQNPYTNDRHLGAIFFRRVAELGDRSFLKLQRGEHFEEISWRDFGAMVQNVLLALYSMGLAPGERVAIVGENSLEWLCADLATLASGLPNVVVSPILSDVLLLKILNHSRCRAAFVQNATAVGRLL